MLKEPGANLVRVFDLHELSLAVAAQNPHEANPFSRAVGLMCFRMAQKWRPPGCSTVELRQRRELLLQCVERLKVAEQPLLCSLAHAQLAQAYDQLGADGETAASPPSTLSPAPAPAPAPATARAPAPAPAPGEAALGELLTSLLQHAVPRSALPPPPRRLCCVAEEGPRGV